MCVVVDDDELLFENRYIAVRINTATVAAYRVTREVVKWPPTPLLLLLRRMETIAMVHFYFFLGLFSVSVLLVAVVQNQKESQLLIVQSCFFFLSLESRDVVEIKVKDSICYLLDSSTYRISYCSALTLLRRADLDLLLLPIP